MTFVVDGTNGLTFNDATTQSSTATNASNISSGTLGKARLPTGSVLQVVQVTTNSSYSVNSTSWTATGFTGSITPTSATSKILMCLSGGQFRYSPSSGQEMWLQVYRSIGGGAYSSLVGDIQEIVISPANTIMAIPHSLQYLDSPATTSAITYQPYMKSNSGPILSYFNLGSVYVYMTLLEISA
jgi:hypothetical protein